ncbi:Uncharacterised protein [Helicobacter cinaedi]|uniref:Uncharacterized protein n=1 Tax=Helicobacter cinaedi TaxID=213 RepID=A0A377JWW7_9HELI|nr:hypothetical protein [Helicobacter cinaedi]STP14353.1 Uncharacterised protein [Helicobacter cinaedi]
MREVLLNETSGNHSADFVDFERSQTLCLASRPKSLKSTKETPRADNKNNNTSLQVWATKSHFETTLQSVMLPFTNGYLCLIICVFM